MDTTPAPRQFCRKGMHDCAPALTLTFSEHRRLHWCAEHIADADPYRAQATSASDDSLPRFTPPTWPSPDSLTSDLLPTLPRGNASVGIALRVGIRDEEVAVLHVGATEAGLSAAGVDALIAALQHARTLITED